MSGHSVVDCSNWEEFKLGTLSKLFGSGPFVRGTYLFRGHGSAHWPLMSSFDRWFKARKAKDKNKAKVAESLMALFQQESEGLGVDAAIWNDEVARLALAQHYGLPTRLLDWTESPYVAAFFAFAGIALNPAPEEFVSVWCLDTRREIWSREFGVEILEIPSVGNERLRNQLGKFTLLRAPYDTLEEYVAHFDGEEHALIQFLIPSSEASRALPDLDVMGINYSRIFPGLEGSARAASLRIQFDVY